MSDNTKRLVKSIEKETRSIFRDIPDKDFISLINIFIGIVSYPIDEYTLQGFEKSFIETLDKLLNEDFVLKDEKSLFSEVNRIEGLWKKMRFLVPNLQGGKQTAKASELSSILSRLKAPEDLKYFSIDNRKQLLLHIEKTVNTRHTDAHTNPAWDHKYISNSIRSLLVVFLYSTFLFRKELSEVIYKEELKIENDFSDYLQKVKNTFSSRIGKFIHIKGKEKIELIGFSVIEKDDENTKDNKIRKGTIDELRKNHIPEKRMLIEGNSGTGKSTTLEFLAYMDADKFTKVSTGKLPVYISLGLLTDSNITILQLIFKKIGVDSLSGEKLLREGKLNLFFDALDEIPVEDLTKRQRQIQEIIDEYKDCFIIMSSRPKEKLSFNGIPIFTLQPMDIDQIREFIYRYFEDDKTLSELLMTEILGDERLKKILSVPLMLRSMIDVVRATGKIPKARGRIVQEFIECLYNRQIYDKKDGRFDKTEIDYLLRSLAYECLENRRLNAALTKDEVLTRFARTREQMGFTIDTVYTLETVTQLGILEIEDDLYRFSHSEYQSYFHAEELKRKAHA